LFPAAEPPEEPSATRDKSYRLCHLREALKIDDNAGRCAALIGKPICGRGVDIGFGIEGLLGQTYFLLDPAAPLT